MNNGIADVFQKCPYCERDSAGRHSPTCPNNIPADQMTTGGYFAPPTIQPGGGLLPVTPFSREEWLQRDRDAAREQLEQARAEIETLKTQLASYDRTASSLAADCNRIARERDAAREALKEAIESEPHKYVFAERLIRWSKAAGVEA